MQRKLQIVTTPGRDADWFADMITRWVKAEQDHQEPADTLDRRQEKLALIRLLRDTTNSRAIHARCVAIVGERS